MVQTTGSAFINIWKVDPARRDDFLAAFNGLWSQFVDVMDRDTNFVFYGWGRDPNQLIIMESWKSEEATNAVRARPIFQESLARMLDCCTEPMTVQIVTGLNSDRSVFDQYPAGKSHLHPSGEDVGSIFL